MAELIELYRYYADMADEYKADTEHPEHFRMFTVLAHIVAREIEVVYA